MATWRASERIAVCVVAAGILGFIALAFLIESATIQALDESVIRMLRRGDDLSELLGPNWLRESARDYTALGGYSVLLTLTTLVFIFLTLQDRASKARFAVTVIVSGYLLSIALKELIDRPRPRIVPHLSMADSGIGGPSFPSGHSTMSTIVYVTLALMLSELAVRKRVKAFLLIAPLAIACAVGISRVLMGVHYPTDVLGGWCVGIVWSVGAWVIVRRRSAAPAD